jgi:hypothetical protein
MKSTDLRLGNQILRKSTGKLLEVDLSVLDHIIGNENNELDTEAIYAPVLLTEENILLIRWIIRDDFHPLLFQNPAPPKPGQFETHYYSRLINENFRIEMSPHYNVHLNRPKETQPDFWHCWINGNGMFITIQPFGGLKYLHQLQNFFYAIFHQEIFL